MGIQYLYSSMVLSLLVNTWQALFLLGVRASDSDNNRSYPGKNMDKRIAEQDKNIAEIVKNVQLIQTVVTAHLPGLKTILGIQSRAKVEFE